MPWTAIKGWLGRLANAPIAGPRSIVVVGGTAVAREGLGHRSLRLERFPFVIGRTATPRDASGGICDLYLPDEEPYQVSRSHCRLVWRAELGGFYVEDTESKLGTAVNGLRIGRRFGRDSAPLGQGENVIILGQDDSPFRLLAFVDEGRSSSNGDGALPAPPPGGFPA